MANVRLLSRSELIPGDEDWAQLFLREAAACTNGQPFVIRSESPVHTIGGGSVLDPNAQRISRPSGKQVQAIADLAGDDVAKRTAASINLHPIAHWQTSAAPRLAADFDAPQTIEQLTAAGIVEVVALTQSQSAMIHADALDRLGAEIARSLERMHREHPLRIGFPQSLIEQRFAYLPDRVVFEMALRRRIKSGHIERRGDVIARAGHGPQLSKNQQKTLQDLLARIRAAGLETPDPKSLLAGVATHRENVAELLQLAVDNGDLHQVGSGYYLHRDTFDETCRKLASAFGKQGFTVSQFREILCTTRKYAVPLAEYLDSLGVTRREGDVRYLVKA